MVSYGACRDELLKIAACRSRMTVSQSRSGRRPMRVSTLLAKDKEGSLFKEAEGSAIGELVNTSDKKTNLPIVGTVGHLLKSPDGATGLQPAQAQTGGNNDPSENKPAPEEQYA